MNITLFYRHKKTVRFDSIKDAVDVITSDPDSWKISINNINYEIVHPGKNYLDHFRGDKTKNYANHKINLLAPNRLEIFFVEINVVDTWVKNWSIYHNLMYRIIFNLVSATAGYDSLDNYNTEQQQELIDFGSQIIHEFFRSEAKFIYPELRSALEIFLSNIATKVIVPTELITHMTHVSKIYKIHSIDSLKKLYIKE